MSGRWRYMAVIAVAALANPAQGQISAPVWEFCGQSSDPDVVVGTCSHLIDAGTLSTDDLVKALARRGQALFRKRDYPAAFKDFERVAQLQPLVAAHRRNLGDARGNLARGSGDTLALVGNLERAIGDFNEAVRLDPNDARNFIHRGDAYIALGRIERGLDDLDKAVAMAPDLAEARNSRGRALHAYREFLRAIADFDEALRLSPENPDILLNRGISRDALEQYDLAIADYDEALRLDPSNALAVNARGVSYVKSGRTDRAIDDFDRALLLDANYAGAYFNRAQAYYLKGNKDRAMADFIQARQLDKRFPEPPEELLEGYDVDINTLRQRQRPFGL